MASIIAGKDMPRSSEICHTATHTAVTRKNVWNASVYTIVLMPPLMVYNQIRTRVVATVTKKGIPQASNRKSCSTAAARYSLKAEPSVRDIRKKNAPVLYDQKLNLFSKYV